MIKYLTMLIIPYQTFDVAFKKGFSTAVNTWL